MDLSGVGEPLVSPAMAASANGDFSAANELPPVAPRQESVPKNLIECRVSVVPRLPVVNLEKPSSAWPDLTPSPVPRVSLIPPTGRIDHHALPSEARYRQTVAPRLRAGGPLPLPPPAITVPQLLLSPPRRGRWARLARDLRSSKREIALGLGIGIGLSLLLGKLGQTYLENRRGGRAGAIEQWTASALPSPEPRSLPASAAAPAPAPAAVAAPAAAAAAAPAATAAAAPAAAVAATAAAPAAAAPAAPAKTPVPPRAPRAPKHRHVQRNLPPIDTNPWGTSDPSPNDDGDARGKSPLTPSESAGLGRELPL